MTKRERFEAIINGTIDHDELVAYAENEIAKMDAANEKRRNTLSKKALENAPLVDRIVNEILGDEPKTASDVAAVLEVSVQKASALCREAVKAERAAVEDIKIKGKGTQKGYTVA